MNVACLPSPWSPAATCFPPSSAMSRIVTIKSFLARRSATACPIPDAPPVTTASLFIDNSFSSDCYFINCLLTPTASANPWSRFLFIEKQRTLWGEKPQSEASGKTSVQILGVADANFRSSGETQRKQFSVSSEYEPLHPWASSVV